MKIVSNADALKYRARYEDGGRPKRITEPDPNAELKAIVSALKDLVSKIAQLAQVQGSSNDSQKNEVLDLIQRQNQSISAALDAFAERTISMPPLRFRVLTRDSKGKAVDFKVWEE